MEALRDKLQKWKVAGAIFLFVAAITIPALGWSFIGDDCCRGRANASMRSCPRICGQCSWGWTCPTTNSGIGSFSFLRGTCIRNAAGGYSCVSPWRTTTNTWPTLC